MLKPRNNLAEKVPTPEKQAYRPREFMRAYGIKKSHFYELVSRGALKTLKCGRATLVSRAEAEAWFASLNETHSLARGTRSI